MRKGGGKQKGAQFERDVCRQLSLWVSKGAQEDVFWRSAMSGGRSTVAAAKGKRLAAQAGDISCIHYTGALFAEQFFVECKFYASLDFQGLFVGRGKFVEFWVEAVEQGRHYIKEPFLIAKQNRYPTFICLNGVGMALLGATRDRAVLVSPPFDMYIFDAEWFLKNVVPINR